MNFTTVSFVFLFLPLVLIYYFLFGFIADIKYKNVVLFVASVLFYGWCGIEYLCLLAALIIVNYVFTNKIIITRSKFWLTASVVLNVLVLCGFKYLTFIFENINNFVAFCGIDSTVLPEPRIPLPLGISFFTFQIIALLADSYKGEIKSISLFELALFIMFFPQLVQGPILRYKDIGTQISVRSCKLDDIEQGIKRFIQGFAKKILIADSLTSVSNLIFENSKTGVANIYAWIGIVCYAFVIYYDFSGYSDMAVGLCKIFGFNIPENFDYPYVSKSIQEFWRRWHISLSNWFRDYIYIPLGGNRGGTFCTYRNLMLVFLVTGIWHGAQWTFIFWGIFHGIFSLIERMGLKKVLDKIPAIFRWFYCMVVVLIGWVFFRAEDMRQAIAYLKCMFIPNQYSYRQIEILKVLDIKFVVVFLVACCICTPKVRGVMDRVEKCKYGYVFNIFYLVLFVVAISAMMGETFSPSIYTKF